MTKIEAIEALKKGNKVTHKLFLPDEFVYIKNKLMFDEYGHNMDSAGFWKCRKGVEWDENWKIYKNK